MSQKSSLPWPFAEMPLFQFPCSLAPNWLQQPILPGWIFANAVSINDGNSSAPEVESEIVSKESYGRQLGYVIDALYDMIEQRPAADRSRGMKELLRLHDKIEQIKADSSERRLESVTSWLVALKKRDAAEYRRVATALKAALAAHN